MKKTIFIVVVMMGIGMISCEKHDCQPNREETAPTWDSKLGVRDGESGDVDDSEDDGSSSFGHGGPIVDTGGSITDPNDDEDGNGRKKKRRR